MRCFVKFLSAFFAFACVLAPLLVAPASAATPEATLIAEVTVTQLNYRNGPGLSYSVTGCFSLGDVVSLTGETVDADGYTWYRCATADTRWVAQVDSMNITPISPTGYTDTITGYDAYGDVVWEHTCTQTESVWHYHLEVKNQSYIVSCDCGWFYERICDIWLYDDGTPFAYFLGLDTDNDERYDLKPGQSAYIPCRANTEFRPYQITEFYGDTSYDPPTVTVALRYKDSAGIDERFVFEWEVQVRVESYGVVFTRKDGSTVVFPIEGEFLVYDPLNNLYLADTNRTYKHGSLIHEDEWWGDGRHVEYLFVITRVNTHDMNPLEWVIYFTNKIGNFFADVFNFFGLFDIFTSSDSPFAFLFGG